jgi:hypothetical protein
MYSNQINSSQEQPSSLAELLPYNVELKKKEELPKVIGHYFFLLKGFYETGQAVCCDRLRALDPLVGETFCQARALKIGSEWQRCASSFAPKMPQIKAMLDEIEPYLSKTYAKLPKMNLLPHQFIQRFALSLSECVTFFFLSCMLTNVNTE